MLRWIAALLIGLPAAVVVWAVAWVVTSGVCAVPVIGGWYCGGPGALPPPTFGFEPLMSLAALAVGGVYIAHEWLEGRA